MKKLLALTAALMLALGLTACGSAAAANETAAETTDAEPETVSVSSLNAGKETVTVEVPYDAQRIAVLDMASLDILDALGVGDRVVGSAKTTLSYLQDYMTEDVAQLGTIKEADLEAVMACEPDVIFIGGRLAEAFPNVTVDVHNPEYTVYVEVRDHAAYVHGPAEPASVAWTCSMYKDRSAFVPGDTVHFKGVVYASDAGWKGHLMPEGEDVTVVLTDSRGSEAGLITLPVGRYGSFAGQFRIPDGGRNGYYSLKVRYNGSYIPVSGASFRVDDFQLPTFSLEFDRQDTFLVPGCPVEVSGRLTSYTGHSLSKASVEYSVETYAGIVSEGPVDLSDDGRFSFVFTDMNAGNYAYYTVKVKVTDATGETLEFSEFLHVSADAELKLLLENEAEGSVEESREGLYYWRADRNVAILDGDVARCKVIIENSDGEEVAGLKVSYSVMAGGSVIGKGTVLSGESLVADLKGRPSGEYRIEAECPVSFVNAAGADSTVISRHELVILKLDEEDESMSSDVENVFRVADGKDISLVFGAGNGPVWAVVELWDSNLVLRHSEMVYMGGCSGLPGSLRTLRYAFLPEYTDKMLLSVFYFKDGNTYSYSHVYERKADMETMLPLEFTLFPDRTAPGAVCRIGLKTLPETELLVAVSDKSVEDISPNIWNPLYSRPVPEPYVNISSVTGYVRCRQEYYPDSGMRPALKSNAVYSARTDADDGVMAFNGLPLEESSAASDVAGPAEGGPVIRSDFRNTLAFEPFLETDVEGTTETYPYYTNRMPSYYSGLVRQVADREFRELLGCPIPSGKWSGELTVNDAICQMYYAKSPIARFVYNKLTKMKKKSEEAGKPDLNILFIYNMPFRAIAKMTGGMVSMEMVEGIVAMVNGHLFKGLGYTIAGFFRNQRQNRKYVRMITGKKR